MSEILMWSHYANNHKGVCLEFEEHKEEEIKGRLIEMQYENAVQIIDEVERYSSGDLSINIDTNGKFLKNKFKNWGYEEELRCYLFSEEINSSGEERPFFGELKSIYFGKNSSHEDIELVKHNTKHFDSLKYYKVDLNIKTMKMENIKEI
jgi:hypothetical protein